MTEAAQEAIEKKEFLNGSPYLTHFSPVAFDWRIALVITRKNLLIALRYPGNWLIWGFMPIMWYAPFILMATAIGGVESTTHFTEITGFDDYITFCVIAWFVYMFMDNSIWAIGNNMRWEQMSGTLEPLFLAPVPRVSLLLGAAFSNTVQACFQVLMTIAISTLVFGPRYVLTQIAPILIILLIMVIALYGFGFMVAGLIIVFKDPSVLTELVSSVTYTISPVQYPLQVLPGPVRFASYLIPTTLAIVTIRELAITGVLNLFAYAQTLGGLTLVAVVFWALGLASFKYAERWTKDRGHMGDF